MKTAELLAQLRKLGADLRLEDDQLICNAPTSTLTPELRTAIKEHKSSIISFLEQAKQARTGSPPPVTPFLRTVPPPLSYAQQRLWYLDQLDPGTAVYTVPMAFHLNGNLDTALLEKSLNEIIRRHEALRTIIGTEDDKPVQLILPDIHMELPLIDLTNLPIEKREHELSEFLRAESQRSFNLSEGPLFRMSLIRMDKEDHVLFIMIHHILFDGWSIDVFLHELSLLYTALADGKPSPLSDLAIQYADFSVWQREWLESGELERQMAYWRKQFADEIPVLQMPTDHPRPAIQTCNGSVESQTIGKRELFDDLKRLSRNEGCTLFMVLLAAFKTLLYRYTGQEDIIVGTPIANRTRSELEELIGFFANTLVLRTHFQRDLPFRQFLGHVRETCLGAYNNQETPFEVLVEELNPDRNLSHTPLFQVLFNFESSATHITEMSGITLSPMDINTTVSRTDMSFWVRETPDGLTGVLEYSTDLFDQETVKRFLHQYRVLLESIVKNPATSIDKLPLLTEAEIHMLLEEWNPTEADYPQDPCIAEFFESQVKRTPSAPAISFEDKTITYQILNRRANKVAKRLRQSGVGPDILVGLCADRSIDLVVGVLAILKAGGAYVPLDPSYPEDRLSFMLNDIQAPVLLTQQGLVSSLPSHTSEIVCLDAPEFKNADNDPLADDNITGMLQPDNLAYVIYTSGSTGTPKGVMVTNANVIRLFTATQAWFNFSSNDVWTLFHSFAFDFSVWELFGALLFGGRLVVVPYLLSRSPETFYKLLAEEKVTVLNQTPAAFRQLIRTEETTPVLPDLSLRFVIFGGEALDLQSLQPWAKRHGDTAPRLINMYGITETTVHVTYRPLSLPDIEHNYRSLIGVPIPDLKVHVLDNKLQPVPIGVPGELYVGGAGLARGYLNRPDLTKERFIADPYSTFPGARLYKTGDLARYLPDGDLEYLGRNDNQVKVRGFRIELGEIENVVLKHPSIREAVVMAYDDTMGTNRLLAYLTTTDNGRIPTGELRGFLKKDLPEYMIPSQFAFLNSMPLTKNGKIDRKALPPLEAADTLKTEAYIPPASETEKVIATIWQEIIGVERISADANFFDTGGHSLLATQLISRLSRQFQIDLKLRTLFESPTITQLASAVDSASRDTFQSQAISPRSQTTPPPLSYAQQRLWYLDQLEPNTPVYTIPMSFRLTGDLDPAVLERCLNEIIRRHEALRTVLDTQDDKPVQVILPTVTIELPLVNLSSLSPERREHELSEFLRLESQNSFNLSEGPLFRMSLVRMDRNEHVLFIMIHHVVFDGWSVDVFFHELDLLYTALAAGEPSPLSELPIQYADFSLWQREWLESGELERQMAFWRKQFHGEIPVLQMPTDRSRPALQTYHGSVESLTISRELVNELTRLGRTEECTLFMVLLAAFKALLYRYTGQDDIIVGTPIANRIRPELEELIGFFANTLVLRTRLQGNLSFCRFLGRVRETCLGAYNNQETPFEVLVEELNPERDLSRTPLFQALFAYETTASRVTGISGIALSTMDFETTVSRTDLSFWVSDTPQGLTGVMEYSTDLFNRETVTRFLEHYRVLLESIVKNPETSIDALPLLSEAEHHKLLVEFNDTSRDYPSTVCMHEKFEEQAGRSPDATALVFDTNRLSYAQLNDKANQLAHYLITSGAGPEKPVAIYMDRSIDMIVSILAILKAGSFYVPLDPQYPPNRIAFILNDIQAPLLLTHTARASDLPASQARILCLDALQGALAEQKLTNPSSVVQPAHLAYAIYTSGSTGTPKGVAIEHRNAVTLINWAGEVFTAEELSGVLASTSVCFDLSIFEIFVPLSAGGTVILAENILQLHDMPAQKEVTLINTVPSAITELLRLDDLPESVHTVNLAGEPLRTELVRQLYDQKSIRKVYDLYGPSEDTTYSTCALRKGDAPATIGRPIANTQAYVLDKNLQPVPLGVIGELYLAGEGLARGYYNRPDLTDERFIPNPFTEFSSKRLYKTGDLVRYFPDGTIEFIGRADNQVKLRGFRIELGEIETVLAEDEALEESVVIVREDRPGDTRLVAYLVACPGYDLQAHKLRAHLRKKLPEYMIPQHFVTLDQIPLTPNGKIDRKALPPLEAADTLKTEAYIPPASETEKVIATIWQEIIGVQQISADANFFDTGGHSLLATQIISRLSRHFHVDLKLRTLFESPTIAQLASAIEDQLIQSIESLTDEQVQSLLQAEDT